MQKLIFAAILPCLWVSVCLSQSLTLLEYADQRSSATIALSEYQGQPALVVRFQGTEDLHYYARSETAPAPDLHLQVGAEADGVTFEKTVFPQWSTFYDKAAEKNIEVYVGNFTVLLPIQSAASKSFDVKVTIQGIACTSEICLPPFTKKIQVNVDLEAGQVIEAISNKDDNIISQDKTISEQSTSSTDPTTQVSSEDLSSTLSQWNESTSAQDQVDRSILFYFALAVLAGLSINIMPCVLPVIPLIIMRLVSQAKESGPRRVALGFSFCGGILLFFVAFAVLAGIINLTTGAVIDLNSLFRSPMAVIVLFLLIVFFALVFLDVITIALPSSVTSRQDAGSGFAGSIGMGFFAGILSTPCSGALLGAVLVWAQTQPLYVSSAAIVLMGIGMALPYALLVSIPSLLNFVPKPGTWMEIVKKAGGFLLLLIAVKFTLTALTKDRLINVLLYGVAFSFCVWMWGGWVGFSTAPIRKWTVRGIAVILAVLTGFWLLPAPQESIIQWNHYDRNLLNKSLENGQPVLIKFTADWCYNCKVVDQKVYQQPDIAKLLEQKNVLAIKADTTQRNYPAAVDLNSVFGEAGNVPVTVILNSEEKTYIKLRGIFNPEELRPFLTQLP
ncbi:MAG: thioredoxin family protein [Sedimentisphaerales bacterium]|nr:thioredoxin family protein [Sedimentisphaerales bacterium]